MKKILPLMLLSISFLASAQTEKGSFMIGGNASIEFNKNDQEGGTGESKTFSMDINPQVGYFVVNNFSLGMSLPISFARGKSTYPGVNTEADSNSDGFGVAPFVRYYIPLSSFFLVTEAAYSWQRSNFAYDNIDPVTGNVTDTNEWSTTANSIRVSAGPTFFLSRHSSIEILANYQHANWESESPLFKSSSFYISVGFQLYLPKNKE